MEEIDGKRGIEAGRIHENSSDDYRLNFALPDTLDTIVNGLCRKGQAGDYVPREEYAYLKETHINLEKARLTDKQLMAVSLVFYGGVKKRRASRAMGISSQALTDHIRLALRKIERSLV